MYFIVGNIIEAGVQTQAGICQSVVVKQIAGATDTYDVSFSKGVVDYLVVSGSVKAGIEGAGSFQEFIVPENTSIRILNIEIDAISNSIRN